MKKNPYAWFAAGAFVASLGVAWVDGAAVATADTNTSSTNSAITRSAGPAAPSRKHSAATVLKTPAVGAVSTAAVSRPTDVRSRSVVSAAQSAHTAADAVTLDPIRSLTRQLNYIFNNTAPTIEAGNQVQGSSGTVAGTVTGQSNNGFSLAYSVGDKPQYGSVVVNADTGAYTYTRNADAPATAAVDNFTIVANNGTAAQLPGILGFAQSLLHAIATGIGASAGDTADTEILVSLFGAARSGDPSGKSQYWQAGTAETSALAAVSMVIGQLTGTMPVWNDLLEEAKTTDSVAKTLDDEQTGKPTDKPAKMYVGGNSWVWAVDGRQLLENHNTIVTGTYYSNSGGLNAALTNLATALERNKSVIVYPTSKAYRSDEGRVMVTYHTATVLSINFTTQKVYLNDGGLPNGGQDLMMPVNDFIKVWGSTYETAVVELKTRADG